MSRQDEQWLLREKYGGEKTSGFFADLERLASGEPLGYVIGYVPFLDTTIHLTSKPLIPRPETEFWVEKAIQEIRNWCEARPTAAPHVLDLCAGSGCIGVAVAKTIPKAHLTFAEIDSAHLPTIKKNCLENLSINRKVFEACIITKSDVFENVTGNFDFILTNPPYIDPALDRTEPSVKNFEPHQALYGGTHGLELIEKILSQAATHLTPNGQLWLEHEPEQVLALQTLSARFKLQATTHTDQYNLPRYSVFCVSK